MKKTLILVLMILSLVFVIKSNLNKRSFNENKENLNIVSIEVKKSDVIVAGSISKEPKNEIAHNNQLTKLKSEEPISPVKLEGYDNTQSKTFEMDSESVMANKGIQKVLQLKKNFKEFEENERDGEWSLDTEEKIKKVLSEYSFYSQLNEALILLECHIKFCSIMFDNNLLKEYGISISFLFHALPRNINARLPEISNYHTRLNFPAEGMTIIMFSRANY